MRARLLCKVLGVLALAIGVSMGNAPPARADTVFTLDQCITIGGPYTSACPASELVNETLTFPGSVPLDGTVFSGVPTLSVSVTPTSPYLSSFLTPLSGTATLPASLSYYYGKNIPYDPGFYSTSTGQPITSYLNFVSAPGSGGSDVLNLVTFHNASETVFTEIGSNALPGGFGVDVEVDGRSHIITCCGGIFVVPPTPPQIVYLDFGAGPAVIEADLTNPSKAIPRQVFYKPDASLSQPQMDAITASIQSLYRNYNVQFTDVSPASSNHLTVYVGGTPTDLAPATAAKITAGTLGLASNIIVGSPFQGDSAVVFSGLSDFNSCTFVLGGWCPDLPLLSQVIAHETGHLLGLAHTDSSFYSAIPTTNTDLMSPISESYSTVITVGPVPRVEKDSSGALQTIDPLGFRYGMQDSNANLLCSVGSSSAGIQDCSGVIGLTGADFSLSSSADTLYGAKLLIEQPGSDTDVGAMAVGLGTISPGFSGILNLPLQMDDSFALIGSLIPDGPDAFFDLKFSNIAGVGPGFVSDGIPLNSVPEPNTISLLFSFLGLIACSHLRSRDRLRSLLLSLRWHLVL